MRSLKFKWNAFLQEDYLNSWIPSFHVIGKLLLRIIPSLISQLYKITYNFPLHRVPENLGTSALLISVDSLMKTIETTSSLTSSLVFPLIIPCMSHKYTLQFLPEWYP